MNTDRSSFISYNIAIDAAPAEVARVVAFIQGVHGGTISAAAIAGQDANITTDAAMPTVAANSNSELDSEGYPWDARIHASTKAITANGTWRTKRNVDDALLTSVRASLKSAVSAPGATPAPAPTVPSAPPAPAPAPAAPINTPYTDLVAFVAAQSPANGGRLTPDYLHAVIVYCGVADGALQSVAHSDEMVAKVHAQLKSGLGL